MRILLINKYLYRRRGAETHVLDLYNLLKKDQEVRVFGMQHTNNLVFDEQEFFVPYVGYNRDDSTWRERFFGIGRIFWSPIAKKKLTELLDSWQPDIAHIHNVYHQLSFSILRELARRDIPIVMTVHDYHLISPDKDEYISHIGKRFYRFLWYSKYSFGKRLLLVLKMYWERSLGGYEAYVRRFIVPSEYVKQQLLAFGIPQEKIVVMPHFSLVPKSVYSSAKESFLLTLSGASTAKGTPTIESIAQALDIRLIVAGAIDSGYKKNTDTHIEYRGMLSRQEVQNLIQRAQAVVSASTLPETFGLVALEALVSGTPFFCLDTGAYGEIVRNGTDGEVCANTQELQAALEHYIQGVKTYDSEEIIRSAQERFGAEHYKERLITLYQSLFQEE